MATAVNVTPATGNTLTGKADSLIEFTWTPAAAETLSIYFRRTDDDNTWRLDCDQAAGTIKLYRRQAASDTEVAAGKTQTWTVSVAIRIEINTFGTMIKTYVSKIVKHETTDAYNQTVKGAKVVGFATGVNFVMWPKGTEGEWSHLTRFFLGG
jgi:hypothetical protein